MSQRDRRLSASPIWTSSRDYYAAKGAAAWGWTGVPTRSCNNAALAAAYASLVRDFIDDCGAGGGGPIHVVEAGAGSGAFAHLFLSACAELDAHLGPPARPIRYVLTDAADANVEFWGSYPRLQPHARAGRLDRARFDVLDDTPLALIDSDTVLSAETLADPVVVIAHYLMDSLPCDVFRAVGGKLEDGIATIDLGAGDAGSNADAGATFTFAPADDPPYGDAALDELCAAYLRRFARTTFTIPVGGIRCLRRLGRLTSGPLLVIAADKGFSSEDELAPIQLPGVARHLGTYTMSVNFDALGKAVVAGGGAAMHTTGRASDLQLAALVVRPPASLARTRAAFVEQIDRSGPIEKFVVVQHALAGELTIDLAISVLNLAAADPNFAALLAPTLRPLLAEASPAQRALVADLFERAAALAFPLRDNLDVSLEIAAVLASLERPEAALASVAHSLAVFGPTPAACFTAAMCRLMLDAPREALALFDQALALDPTFAPALHWRPQAVAAARGAR